MKLSTIIFVYLALTALWSSIAHGMEERHHFVHRKLQADVAGLWGREHHQALPKLSDGTRFENTDIKAGLTLEYRQKGQYWYSTYLVDFEGRFQLRNGSEDRILHFPLPSGAGMFSGVVVEVDQVPVEYSTTAGSLEIPVSQNAKEVSVDYRGQGSHEWWLNFEETGVTQNLRVELQTNFRDVDFPDGSVSPVTRVDTEKGAELVWDYQNLLTGAQIGLTLPQKPNPGPALINICRYAPLGLFLFFAALTVCGATWGKLPHPMHYCFLGTSFFSFHLLLVYLGDLLSLTPAFLISSIVSLFLSLSYGRRIFEAAFLTKRVFPALLLYLVGFSSAFLVEGFKGLPLVLLLILTLHMAMQLTASVDWGKMDKAV